MRPSEKRSAPHTSVDNLGRHSARACVLATPDCVADYVIPAPMGKAQAPFRVAEYHVPAIIAGTWRFFSPSEAVCDPLARALRVSSRRPTPRHRTGRARSAGWLCLIILLVRSRQSCLRKVLSSNHAVSSGIPGASRYAVRLAGASTRQENQIVSTPTSLRPLVWPTRPHRP